jgi:hypothetical protein
MMATLIETLMLWECVVVAASGIRRGTIFSAHPHRAKFQRS